MQSIPVKVLCLLEKKKKVKSLDVVFLILQRSIILKGYTTFFFEISSFYHSPRVKQLSFTVFECIQPIF